jgi:Cu/Ag efflux protein CusF
MRYAERARRGLITVTFALLTGCGAPSHDPATDHDAAESSGHAEPPSPDIAHAATGTVVSVNHEAATAVIHHDPVVSIGMPEMTMTFRLAEPALADQLRAGDRIAFEFVVDDGVVITQVSDSRHVDPR